MSKEIKNPVIACIDGTPAARAVCDYGAWAASTLGAPLVLLHITAQEDPGLARLCGREEEARLMAALANIEEARTRLRIAHGKALLADCAAQLKQAGQAPASLLQKHGSPEAILSGLDDIRLMVLGRGEAQNLVGSLAESLIRLQSNPVLVAPASFTPPSQVMLAYDGSIESRKNLARLTASPLLYGLDCHIVMVNGSATVLKDAHAELQKAGIRAQAHMLEGTSVTASLCRYAQAQAIDLIVMGAWGHSQRRRFFIGSHAAAMLFRCRQPLLILR